MIDINTLTEADVGRWVNYTPTVGPKEPGRLRSWNDKWVFIVYKCDNQWNRFQDFTAAATDPDELEFQTREKTDDKPH